MLTRLVSYIQTHRAIGSVFLKEPIDPSYSWQEAFTDLLKSLMSSFEKDNIKNDLEIREDRILSLPCSRLSDVEVPSLIWLTGLEDDILILEPMNSDAPWSFEMRAILPVLTRALWGDRLRVESSTQQRSW